MRHSSLKRLWHVHVGLAAGIAGVLGTAGCTAPPAPEVVVATPAPEPLEPPDAIIGVGEPEMIAPDPRATSLLGRWEGIGKQNSGPTWKMVLTIDSLEAGRCATVRYPSIPCGGHWKCTKASDGFVLEGREVITEGRGRCHDNVPVMVRLARDRQSVVFVVEAGPDSAQANLRRSATTSPR